MKVIGLFLLVILFATQKQAGASDHLIPGDYLSQTESPHAEAIRLVMELCADEIRKVDGSSEWWHDTKERSWSARRRAAPGVMDTTDNIEVSYLIDGDVVASWSVWLRKRFVSCESDLSDSSDPRPNNSFKPSPHQGGA